MTGTGLESRMLPVLDDDNREFWTSGGTGQLRLPRCGACDRWIFPPTLTCPDCGGPASYQPVSGQGTVFTFTVNYHPFNPAVSLPYVLAVVELAEQSGLRFTTNIVNCAADAVTIGLPVHVVFEPHDEVFVPLFEPN